MSCKAAKGTAIRAKDLKGAMTVEPLGDTTPACTSLLTGTLQPLALAPSSFETSVTTLFWW